MQALKILLFILALIVELVLLTVILIFFIFGIVGIFLPVVPGIILAGAGLAIYSLMIKNNFGAITPIINTKIINNRGKILSLPLVSKTMTIINHFKKKKVVQEQTEVIKNGVILFGFNFLLVLFYIFANLGVSFLLGLTNSPDMVAAFVPLLVIFMFASLSAVIWYRFGQILGPKFKERKIINSSLVVLLSILPLLMMLLLLSSILNLVGGFKQEFLSLAFLSILLISILASVFELIIVTIGAVTAKK